MDKVLQRIAVSKELNPIDVNQLVGESHTFTGRQYYDDKLKDFRQKWMDGMLQSRSLHSTITHEEVSKPILVLLDTVSLMNGRVALMDSPLGIMFSHHLLTERDTGTVQFESVYEIDQTQLATISPANFPVPKRIESVQFAHLTRQTAFQDTARIAITVEKSLFEEVVAALRLFTSQRWLADGYEKYVGENKHDPLAEPYSQIPTEKLRAFMMTVNKQHVAATNGGIGATIKVALMKVSQQSPVIWFLPRHRSFNVSLNRDDWFLNAQSQACVLTFGLNKYDGMRREFKGSVTYLEHFLQIFITNTDNLTMDQVHKPTITIDGNGEQTPIAVLICLDSTYRYMLRQGMLKSGHGRLKQFKTRISLAHEDFNPLNFRALQGGVIQKSDKFVRDKDGGFVKDTHITDHVLSWMNIQGELVLVAPMNQHTLTDDSVDLCGLKTNAVFDMMIPQGVVMTETGEPEMKRGVDMFPTTVSFMDNHGTKHTFPQIDFSSGSWKPWVKCVFAVRNLAEFGGYRVFDKNGKMTFRGSTTDSWDGVERKDGTPVFKEHHSLHSVADSFLVFHEVNAADQKKLDDTMNAHSKPTWTIDKKRFIVLNELVCENRHFCKELFIDNVLKCMVNFEAFEKLANEFVVKTTQDNMSTYDQVPNTKCLINDNNKYKDKSIGFSLTFKYGHNNATEFALTNSPSFLLEECMARYTSIIDRPSANYTAQLEKRMFGVIRFHLGFPNIGYSVVPNLINFLNPGIAFHWHMQTVVEQEGMIMARPCAFTSIASLAYTEKMSEMEAREPQVGFCHRFSTSITKQSLNYGSVLDSSALLVSYVTRPTAWRLGPEDLLNVPEKYDPEKVRSFLANPGQGNSMNEYERDTAPWIPLIAGMFSPVNYWGGTGMSPVGRMNGHYESKDQFDSYFFDKNVMDVKYKRLYTMNPIWTNMRVNLNMSTLIEPQLAENECFFLNKYTHFNETTAASTNTLRGNHQRATGQKSYSKMDEELNAAMFTDREPFTKYLSVSRGCAFAKYCATSEEQLCPTELRKTDRALTNGVCRRGKSGEHSHHYRINGNLTLEKFDKYGETHDLYF